MSQLFGYIGEALATLARVLIGPALIALVVVLVRSIAKAHPGPAHAAGGVPAVGGSAPASKAWAVLYVVIGVVAGAAGAFVSLTAYFVGVALALVGGVVLLRRADRHRWFALGGFLLGMGACAAGFLSPALTNQDPAVSWDPSTIPVFFISVAFGLCGAVTLVLATGTALRRRAA